MNRLFVPVLAAALAPLSSGQVQFSGLDDSQATSVSQDGQWVAGPKVNGALRWNPSTGFLDSPSLHSYVQVANGGQRLLGDQFNAGVQHATLRDQGALTYLPSLGGVLNGN